MRADDHAAAGSGFRTRQRARDLFPGEFGNHAEENNGRFPGQFPQATQGAGDDGDMTLLATGNDAIYAFTRSAGAETIAVVLNLSNEVQQGVQIAGLGSGTVLIGPPWEPGKAMPAQSTVILDVSS